MKQMPIIKYLMRNIKTSPRPFINHNNELILIPKFNVYFLLDDVEYDFHIYVKLCEYFSRDCCCALRYKNAKMLNQYYQNNTDTFNKVCDTRFTIEDMNVIYTYLGNGINHKKAIKFVTTNFDLSILVEV